MSGTAMTKQQALKELRRQKAVAAREEQEKRAAMSNQELRQEQERMEGGGASRGEQESNEVDIRRRSLAQQCAWWVDLLSQMGARSLKDKSTLEAASWFLGSLENKLEVMEEQLAALERVRALFRGEPG